MDIFDKASDREQQDRDLSIANARKVKTKLTPVGFCHYCSDPVGPVKLFCDSSCTEYWQEEENARIRNMRR